MSTESIYKALAGERAIMARYDALLAHWPVPHTTDPIANQTSSSKTELPLHAIDRYLHNICFSDE